MSLECQNGITVLSRFVVLTTTKRPKRIALKMSGMIEPNLLVLKTGSEILNSLKSYKSLEFCFESGLHSTV